MISMQRGIYVLQTFSFDTRTFTNAHGSAREARVLQKYVYLFIVRKGMLKKCDVKAVHTLDKSLRPYNCSV